MAYDRYDTRDAPRDERSRWSDQGSNPDRSAFSRQDNPSDRGRQDDRGFWDRASDEVASWFGDEDAERRRRQDQQRDERESGWSSRDRDRDYDRGYGRDWNRDHDRDRTEDQRSWYETRGLNERGGFSERDYNPRWRNELRGNRERSQDREREWNSDRERGYRPMAGDYGREGPQSDQFFAASGYGRNDYGRDRGSGRSDHSGYDRSQTPWGEDQYRRTSYAGSGYSGWRERDFDPNYRSWRDRHMSDLDRDYDEYRREHQSRFENDFGTWRERRMRKRDLLGRIHEHMEVVGSDDQHVGTVDKVAGDRIILTKSDPDSGGVHHSLSCADLDRIEGDKVILDCTADEAKRRWRDESRDRALFEREDQGEMGPRMLDRSFEGTYR